MNTYTLSDQGQVIKQRNIEKDVVKLHYTHRGDLQVISLVVLYLIQLATVLSIVLSHPLTCRYNYPYNVSSHRNALGDVASVEYLAEN